VLLLYVGQFLKLLASIIAVNGVEHSNTVQQKYCEHDHSSLQWSRLSISETVRLLDIYVKHVMFHFLCAILYTCV